MKEKATKKHLSEWAARKFDIPADLFPGECRLELRGRNMLTLHGCERILEYTPDEMRFALQKGDCVTVVGKRMTCATYVSGTVVVDGWICAFHFSEEEMPE